MSTPNGRPWRGKSHFPIAFLLLLLQSVEPCGQVTQGGAPLGRSALGYALLPLRGDCTAHGEKGKGGKGSEVLKLRGSEVKKSMRAG